MAAFPEIPDMQIAELMNYVDRLDESSAANEDREAQKPIPLLSEKEPFRSGYHHFFSDNGLLGPPPWSKLVAYELNEGKILWQKRYGDEGRRHGR